MLTITNKFKSLLKPIDINVALLIKFISALNPVLRKISPLASFVFIAINLGRLLKAKFTLVTLVLFIPALILSPGMDTVRITMSVAIMWIFFLRFDDPEHAYSPLLTGIILIFTVAMFSGVSNPDYYYIMGDGSARYKYIMERHNELCLFALLSFVYLLNAIIQPSDKPINFALRAPVWIGIILLAFIFLSIKSRLYIGLSLGCLFTTALLCWKSNKLPAIAAVFYIVIFFGFDWINTSLNIQIPGSGNERLISTYATGREKLNQAFYELGNEVGWENFIVQNNSQKFYQKKLTIPGINMEGSTLTENTYIITILNTGFLGLAVLLAVCIVFLLRFLKRKEYFSMLFMLLIMGVWYYEESVMFPLNMIAKFFALATINRLERKRE